MVFYHNYVCRVWNYVLFFKMCKPHERNNNKPVKQSFFFCINKACKVWKIILATEKTALTIGQNGDQNDRQSNIIIFFYSLQNWANKRLYIGSAQYFIVYNVCWNRKKIRYLNFHLRLSCEYQKKQIFEFQSMTGKSLYFFIQMIPWN